MTDVLFVTVNYHTEAHIERLVESLREQTRPWRLAILDNGSEPVARDRLRRLAEDPAIEYRPTGSNLGYFGAVFEYVSVLRGGALPEWLVISNPDIVLEPDFVSVLVDVDADVVAPGVRDAATGVELNPYMDQRPTPWFTWSRRMLFRYAVTAQLLIAASWAASWAASRAWSRRRTTNGRADPRPVYAGHGALIALRRSYFDLGADVYHPPFLFGEEVTVGENARRVGGVVLYVPALRADHIGHVTTRLRRPRHLLACQRDAARYVDEMIRGRRPA